MDYFPYNQKVSISTQTYVIERSLTKMQEELDNITGELNRALGIENKTDRFMSLSEVAVLTDSSSLPVGVKERVLKKIECHQLESVDLK